jgi:hypothetical protein
MEAIESHAGGLSPEAVDFVRFCYARRPVAWPEFYDEMSAVAARCLFHGWGYPELAEHGIALTLPEMPRLAALVEAIVRSERTHPTDGSRPSPGAVTTAWREPLAAAR